MDNEPFIGSEAVAAGLVRKHQLRANYQLIFPDVYIRNGSALTVRRRAAAAWLWSHRQGVIAGRSAAALHGAKWVDEAVPVEMIWTNARAPKGIQTSDSWLSSEEFGMCGDLKITTPQRTAFDIGRRRSLDAAIAELDALGNATRFAAQDVLDVAAKHPGARGVRRLQAALDAYDPGAESPRESALRLLLVRAGFPRPRTQIPVLRADGWSKYYLDMGWEDIMLAVEYDGDHHRSDPVRYRYDIERLEELNDIGWTVVRVVKGNRGVDIVRRVEHARASRLR